MNILDLISQDAVDLAEQAIEQLYALLWRAGVIAVEHTP